MEMNASELMYMVALLEEDLYRIDHSTEPHLKKLANEVIKPLVEKLRTHYKDSTGKEIAWEAE